MRIVESVHEKINLAEREWDGKQQLEEANNEKKEDPLAPYTAITGYGTVNKTPAKRRSIEQVYK